MKKTAISKQIQELIEPVAAESSIEIVNVEYISGGGPSILRIFIDKEGGVTIADCAAFSKEISGLLDVADPIPGKFSLEVSSPGINRPLLKPRDFERFAGRKVSVSLFRPLTNDSQDIQKRFQGILGGYSNGVVKVTLEGGKEIEIPEDLISKANLE
ncbi:MAG TPA: ribosome maturation factor RimP [Bdellovibrionota bacterium]|nr:ribosome maturation factor RimP [Bdellovibrionota bacterium]